MKGICLIVVGCLAFAAHASARTPLSTIIDRALDDGTDAILPAPLSRTLGVSRKDRPMPARQLLFRSGHTVHAFNVDPEHRHEIVLYVIDEETKRTTGYLMTPAGRLRKIVTYREGEEPVTVPRAHAGVEFSAERDAWTERPSPSSH